VSFCIMIYHNVKTMPKIKFESYLKEIGRAVLRVSLTILLLLLNKKSPLHIQWREAIPKTDLSIYDLKWSLV